MGDAKEWRQGVFGVVRNGLLALQVAHLSRWWETSDALVGVLGVLTSILDISQVWPEKSVAVPSTKEDESKESKCICQRNKSGDSMVSTHAPFDAWSPQTSGVADAS